MQSVKNSTAKRWSARNTKAFAPRPATQPADHTEKELLFNLIEATRNTDVKLTESFAMWPAAAVSGFYFAHPESQYFAVGNLGKDQVEDYARRKKMNLATLERWLSPNLGYEPQD